ncbi:hypothetical protein ElyMa_003965200 [Elysia marginata]|uniref:Uncharacterized protein n=1 Tax=Elysia marginata TaxID=1093978 RepID=A0AAV4FYE0_9GAST|nr:hypothetical protein ElyMa_003965200 [Elysia marginata]
MSVNYRLCAHLSLRLSPPHVHVIVGTFDDLNGAFFDYRGYDLTVSQIDDSALRLTQFHHNSYRLLETIADMLRLGNVKSMRDAHVVCAALSVPAYHVVRLFAAGGGDAKRVCGGFLDYCTTRFTVGSTTKRKRLLLLTPHRLHRRSLENCRSYRHAVEIYALVRRLTRDFSVKIEGVEFADPVPPVYRQTYKRIRRLVLGVFGDNCASLLGVNISIAAFNAYLCLYCPGAALVPFRYSIRPVTGTTDSDAAKLEKRVANTVRDTMDLFLVGIYPPRTSRHCDEEDQRQQQQQQSSMWKRWLFLDDKRVCKNMTYDDLNTSVTINNQVVRVHVHSKKRLEHGISGKSLVTMVFKNPLMTGSAYKDIDEDMVLTMENTINTNLHGYDSTLILMLLTMSMFSGYCTVDRLAPFDQSHNRYSTNSFQNGVIDTNSYRNTVMSRYSDICIKVNNFPAIELPNLKVYLHRESVSLDVTPGSESELPLRLKKVKKIIGSASEMDACLERDLYRYMERPTKELVDKRSIGMFKMAHLCGRHDLKRRLCDLIVCDRYLLAFDAKRSKSDFANKSRFEPDSRGKTSKRLKSHDADKNRVAFQEAVSARIPDASSDPHNSNPRGTWSVSDKVLINSSDWLFYSPMMLYLIDEMRRLYPAAANPNINELVSMVWDNIRENAPELFN